jgi:glycosyltransferase involved in cell wall biosynthesis
MEKKILIGMPSYQGLIPAVMVQSLLQLQKPCPCAFMVIERQRIDKARNAIALEAIKGGFDYLFFVDDDNPIPPDTLVKFIEDDKDVVIAPILGRNPDATGKHKLCAFYSKAVNVDEKQIRIYYNIDVFRDEGPLHKVDAAGTGAMLIKKEVLLKMFAKHKEQMFEFGDIRFGKEVVIDGQKYDRRTMSEDCEFSERVTDLGFEIWLDERVRPIHLTNIGSVQWTM